MMRAGLFYFISKGHRVLRVRADWRNSGRSYLRQVRCNMTTGDQGDTVYQQSSLNCLCAEPLEHFITSSRPRPTTRSGLQLFNSSENWADLPSHQKQTRPLSSTRSTKLHILRVTTLMRWSRTRRRATVKAKQLKPGNEQRNVTCRAKPRSSEGCDFSNRPCGRRNRQSTAPPRWPRHRPSALRPDQLFPTSSPLLELSR